MTATEGPIPDPTADMPPRRRRWFPRSLRMFALMLFVMGLASAYRGFRLTQSINGLVANSALPGSVRLNWSTGPASPVRFFDSVHVHVPPFIGTVFSDPSANWLATPFCQIDEVNMSSADSKILEVLNGCSRLRVLDLRRIRNTSHGQWNGILRLPLEELWVVDSGLPSDALTQISRTGTIKSLVIAGEGPFSAAEAASLGRCRNLEFLTLQDVKGLPDDALGREIGRLTKLKRVDLSGREIGENTVLALRYLPALTEVWIMDTDLGPDLFAKLAECPRLHTICISRSSVDDTVLTAFMGVSTLKTCILQDGTITTRAIEAFREKRSDVKLTILTKLRIPNGPDG
jgi:hypothetical protein